MMSDEGGSTPLDNMEGSKIKKKEDILKDARSAVVNYLNLLEKNSIDFDWKKTIIVRLDQRIDAIPTDIQKEYFRKCTRRMVSERKKSAEPKKEWKPVHHSNHAAGTSKVRCSPYPQVAAPSFPVIESNTHGNLTSFKIPKLQPPPEKSTSSASAFEIGIGKESSEKEPKDPLPEEVEEDFEAIERRIEQNVGLYFENDPAPPGSPEPDPSEIANREAVHSPIENGGPQGGEDEDDVHNIKIKEEKIDDEDGNQSEAETVSMASESERQNDGENHEEASNDVQMKEDQVENDGDTKEEKVLNDVDIKEENVTNDEDMKEEKETNDATHPIELLRLEDDVLDFEDLSSDEEGNFKRKRKEDSPQAPVNQVMGHNSKHISVFDTGKELEKSLPRLGLQRPTNLPRVQAAPPVRPERNNDVKSRVGVAAVENDRDRGGDWSESRLLEEFEKLIDADPCEAYKLFHMKTNQETARTPSLRNVLQRIALNLISAPAFTRLMDLQKKLFATEVVDSKFWNSIVEIACRRYDSYKGQQASDAMPLKRFLKEVHMYLTMKENIWISLKNAVRLAAVVKPPNESSVGSTLCSKCQVNVPSVQLQANSVNARATVRTQSQPTTANNQANSQQKVPVVTNGNYPARSQSIPNTIVNQANAQQAVVPTAANARNQVRMQPPPAGVAVPPPIIHPTQITPLFIPLASHIIGTMNGQGPLPHVPQQDFPVSPFYPDNERYNLPEKTEELTQLFRSSRYRQVNDTLLRNLQPNVPVSGCFVEAFKNSITYDKENIAFRFAETLKPSAADKNQMVALLSKNQHFSEIVIHSLSACIAYKKFRDVTQILKLLAEYGITLSTSKPCDLCEKLFLYAKKEKQISLVAPVVHSMCQFLSKTTGNVTINKPSIAATEKNFLIDLLVTEVLSGIEGKCQHKAVEELLRSALCFYTKQLRPAEESVKKCILMYLNSLINSKHTIQLWSFWDYIKETLIREIDLTLDKYSIRAMVAFFCNTEDMNTSGKEIFEYALTKNVYNFSCRADSLLIRNHDGTVKPKENRFNMIVEKYLTDGELTQIIRHCMCSIMEQVHAPLDGSAYVDVIVKFHSTMSTESASTTGVDFLDKNGVATTDQLTAVLMKTLGTPVVEDKKIFINFTPPLPYCLKRNKNSTNEKLYSRPAGYVLFSHEQLNGGGERIIPETGPEADDPRMSFWNPKVKRPLPPEKPSILEQKTISENNIQQTARTCVRPSEPAKKENDGNSEQMSNGEVMESRNTSEEIENKAMDEEFDLLTATVDSVSVNDLPTIVTRIGDGSRRVILPSPVKKNGAVANGTVPIAGRKRKIIKVKRRLKVPG